MELEQLLMVVAGGACWCFSFKVFCDFLMRNKCGIGDELGRLRSGLG
jgi:hypothetical protein